MCAESLEQAPIGVVRQHRLDEHLWGAAALIYTAVNGFASVPITSSHQRHAERAAAMPAARRTDAC